MTTTTVKTIGATGDYTTLQSWEDAAPANLVTSDIVWQGQCQNQEFTSAATLLTISGSTVDATRYKELTTVSGASFIDNAGVQTNPLFYDSTKGAAISCTGSYVIGVVIGEAYARVNRLQIRGTVAASSAYSAISLVTNSWVDKCILSSNVTNGSYGTVNLDGGRLSNVAVICTAASAAQLIRSTGAGAVYLYNVTAASISSVAAASAGYRGSYNLHTHKNCAYFNVTVPLFTGSGAGTPTSTTCYTDGTATTGWTNITLAAAGFVNSASDFRIGSGSSLLNVGTTDSTNAATDIAGTARPSGTAYDVGAWEYVSAGGLPTLSASTYVPGSLTSTGWRPRVTATY